MYVDIHIHRQEYIEFVSTPHGMEWNGTSHMAKTMAVKNFVK